MTKTVEMAKWVGRWVRFYQSGTLVIGVVNYVDEPFVGTDYKLITDVGATSVEQVKEWR